MRRKTMVLSGIGQKVVGTSSCGPREAEEEEEEEIKCATNSIFFLLVYSFT